MIGAKIDLSLVKRSGKKAVVINFLTFFMPLGMNLLVANISKTQIEMGTPWKICLCDCITPFCEFIPCHCLSFSWFEASQLGAWNVSNIIINYQWNLQLGFSSFGHDNKANFNWTKRWTCMDVHLCFPCCHTHDLCPKATYDMDDREHAWREANQRVIHNLHIRHVTRMFIFQWSYRTSFYIWCYCFGNNGTWWSTAGISIGDQKLESFVSILLLPGYFIYSVVGVNFLGLKPVLSSLLAFLVLLASLARF